MVQLSFPVLGGLYAYIDPQSGTIIVQVIISGLVGTVAYFFGPIWRFFRTLGGKKKGPSPPPSEQGGPERGPTADQPQIHP